MKQRERAILQLSIAALVILSAAICAAPQSHAAGRDLNAPGGQPIAPAKQNSRKTDAPPAKQNSRAGQDNQASPQSQQGQQGQQTAQPLTDATRYFYEFRQPDFLINHLQIEHDAAGRGHVSFEKLGSDEPITEPLELSEAALARIRTLWDNLHFLDSEKVYQSERQYPHLGTVRLSMKQPARSREVEFNWTDDKDARSLADEYRRAGDQAIFVFDISVALENDKLNTPKLMDQLESMLKRNGLSDPQQLLPLLTDLSTDERIPLIARNHAGRLLKQIKK